MKKILLMTAIAAMGLGGCDKRPEPLKIDNALTAEEIAAGRLTPEVMWKMSRAGGSSLSPDGRTLLYQQTDYNMAENRGVTTIRVEDMDSKTVTCLTDFTSNSLSPKWSADGRHIYFLSDRGGCGMPPACRQEPPFESHPRQGHNARKKPIRVDGLFSGILLRQ